MNTRLIAHLTYQLALGMVACCCAWLVTRQTWLLFVAIWLFAGVWWLGHLARLVAHGH